MPTLLDSSHQTSDKLSRTSIASLSAIILAGGAGRRMGGLDKGLVHYQGKPLVQWVKESLPASVKQVIISCNRHADDYSQFGQTIADLSSEFTYGGALSGIAAGLGLCQHNWVIIAPCDLIFYPTDFAHAAWTALTTHVQQHPQAAKIAVAHDGERRQNLCLLIHKEEINSLTQALQNSRAVHHWLDARQALNIPWADAHAFLNINEPAQLNALRNTTNHP